MAQALPTAPPTPEWEVRAPDTSHLITDDGAPVDSFFSEKQMRLLTRPLYEGWSDPKQRKMIAAANVGVFAVPKNNPLVPDVFVSFHVEVPRISGDDRIRSYFVWEFGKPPDVVIEVVSEADGGELSTRLRGYERMRVALYVVFDPNHAASAETLTAFRLQGLEYVQITPSGATEVSFAELGLGLTLWTGTFEDAEEQWLRWTDHQQTLIPTGEERALVAEAERDAVAAERDAAEAERDAAEARAEAAEAEIARLRALLTK